MSRETQKQCRYVKCNNKVNKGGIETHIGWFCSKKCSNIVVKRIFKVLLGFPLTKIK